VVSIRRLRGITLTVSNLERSVDFYERVLGLQKKYEFEDYAGFDCCGVELGLKTWGGLEESREGEPILELVVDDVEAACDELEAEGVRAVEGPRDRRWGAKVAVIADPDGNRIALVQLDWREYLRACIG